MTIAILGAGAFGTSLAIALSRDGAPVTLWGRDSTAVSEMNESRRSGTRLPGHALPDSLRVTSDLDSLDAETCLLAVPMQQLANTLAGVSLPASRLVACCKGVDQRTGDGPVQTLDRLSPTTFNAMLTGPSFAADIASGLPTALVLAGTSDDALKRLQDELSRPLLRIYRSTDVIGAELGGALKNVIAIAAGLALGAGLGDSARASVISRGFAEMVRYAVAQGASPETLHGLSGLGDLVLTCTSEKSRNFSAGLALGAGKPILGSTVEGLATARAVAHQAKKTNIEMPLTSSVARVVAGELDLADAIKALMARPVGEE